MKYFYLTHSVMGLTCLKGLVSGGAFPELVIIHKDRDRVKLSDNFYEPLKNFCAEKGIELAETESIIEVKYKLLNYDIGICAGFMDILNEDIFTLPKYGILNLHCGKLPDYRGRAPICRSIMNGEKFLTVTVHKIDHGVDTGDICSEHKIEICPDDDVNTLYEKCSAASSEVILNCLKELNENKLIFHKQSPDLPPNKRISSAERKINWHDISLNSFNKIRALTLPYPCAYSVLDGKIFLFIKANFPYREYDSELSGGTIINVGLDCMNIKTGSGEIQILQICDENLNTIIFNEHFKTGDKFE